MVTCFPDIFCARKILYRKTESYRSTLKLVGKDFYLPGNVLVRYSVKKVGEGLMRYTGRNQFI